MKQVKLVVDYGMVSHGLAPLFVDGRPTELSEWKLSTDTVRRITRLNELYDRQINWKNPADRRHRISDRDRNEFNALLPFVASELATVLGDQWEIVVDTDPISAPDDAANVASAFPAGQPLRAGHSPRR